MNGECGCCVACHAPSLVRSNTAWKCSKCSVVYPCTNGIPRLLDNTCIGSKDTLLRDTLYDTVFGKFYAFLMPYLLLPVLPLRLAYKKWIVYWLSVFAAMYVPYIFLCREEAEAWETIVASILLAVQVYFYYRFPLLIHHLLVVPWTALMLCFTKFRDMNGFASTHKQVIDELESRSRNISHLDVACGSCNSLIKHGWLSLQGPKYGLDLSGVMLGDGQMKLARLGMSVHLILGDALNLPFENETFDVVTCYGSVNAYTDSLRGVEEMARVCKKDGYILFYDEQCYPEATLVERWYFRFVLSGHDTIHQAPHMRMERLSKFGIRSIKVEQVRHYYYLATLRK